MPAGGENRARAFYGEVLELPERPKPPPLAARGGCWFEAESVKIHLGVEPDFRPCAKAHPGLLVGDLDSLLARCRDKGFHATEPEIIEATRRAFVRDPFDNRIELIERTSSAAVIPGAIQLLSYHPVNTTIDRLEGLLKQRGILVFARIDFSGDAGRAGLRMRAQQMLIFGNPKAGTPLLLAAPAAGLDLPLKLLSWEATDGRVWVAYNDPQYIVQRYRLPGELAANLAAVVPLIERAVAQ
ncbi:MAG: DUF302 domain-containing protein [Steroidobacterales bacterium]|jgi:uncharacterized protein (DUF302 family)